AAASLKIITTGYVYVVERLGKYHKTLEPGFHFIYPFVDVVRSKVNLKQQILEIEPQSVITKDNVKILIDNVVFYTVVNAKEAIYNIESFRTGVIYSSAINMRNVVGDMALDEILSNRANINSMVLKSVEDVTRKYGVEILSVEIKNIIPPAEITSVMEKEMTAERTKRAVILQANGEKQSAIAKAEGLKQSVILNAEADKESNIRRAEGSKESQLLEAEGKARAIEAVAEAQAKAYNLINKAILESGTNETIIALKQVEALIEMAKNPANKLIIPMESISTLGNISAIAETLKLIK
ncbi:MAG TPA: SPFH domain-containing protein, partial [Clostridiaceae bacterium]